MEISRFVLYCFWSQGPCYIEFPLYNKIYPNCFVIHVMQYNIKQVGLPVSWLEHTIYQVQYMWQMLMVTKKKSNLIMIKNRPW